MKFVLLPVAGTVLRDAWNPCDTFTALTRSEADASPDRRHMSAADGWFLAVDEKVGSHARMWLNASDIGEALKVVSKPRG